MFICLTGLLAACEVKPETYRYSGSIMGTYYNLSFIEDDIKDEVVDGNKLHQGALSAMQQVNQRMSTYSEDSELSVLNSSTNLNWLSVSESLFEVLNTAVSVATLTQGAFDITIAPLVNAWGFGSNKKQTRFLTDAESNNFVAYIGADKFSIDQQKGIKKYHPKVKFDLSAIAKGYAVDQVAQYLLEQNVQNFLIDIGGELRAKGVNEDNKPWQIGIEKPQLPGGLQQIVALQNRAIATSGDYRNFVEVDGRKYSHTFDPRTLKPVRHNLASVSVIADNAMLADALATALMVMGEKQAYDFAIKHNLPVYLIIRAADGYEIRFTKQFKPYLPL